MLISNPQEFRENLRKSVNKIIKKENISINLEKAILYIDRVQSIFLFE